MYTMAKWLGNVCYISDGLGNSFSLMVFFNSIPSINLHIVGETFLKEISFFKFENCHLSFWKIYGYCRFMLGHSEERKL